MRKQPNKKNAVLSAHAEEQMEGHAKSFLVNLEHYGISGVLFLKFENADNKVLVFSQSDDDRQYVKLLKESAAMSIEGAKAIIDNNK